MNARFEFVPGDEITIAPGRTVKRIRALAAIPVLGVSPGDLGGYVENTENICGDAWVYGDAQVSDNAQVSGNARVYGNALVYGDAQVYGDALVSGDAWVSGNAWVSGSALVSGDARVSGSALVSGDARVSGDADWLLVGPSKSSGRYTTAHNDEKIGVRVNCGCFSGSVPEFSQAIEKTHANNHEALHQYRLFCQLIAFNFGVEK